MRLHGDVKFSRSNVLKEVSHYSEYKEYLRKDFVHRCGYCSKCEEISTTGFEIDHFIPLKIDASKICDYNNLVYSCFTCNRKKGSKWPTQSPQVFNDGTVGFVDPVSDDYDNHIGRDQNGNIEYYTELGRYMGDDVFKFHIRPMRLIWKLNTLIEKERILRKMILDKGECRNDEGMLHVRFCDEIEKLFNYIFEKRE